MFHRGPAAAARVLLPAEDQQRRLATLAFPAGPAVQGNVRWASAGASAAPKQEEVIKKIKALQ